jgi:hypothetical protein
MKRTFVLFSVMAAVVLAVPILAGAQSAKPDATTGGATNVTRTSATVTGTVDPNGRTTTYHFRYGTTKSYGSRTPNRTAAADGTGARSVSAGITGLSPGTTYHYQLVATNTAGTSRGADRTFRTAGVPSATGLSILATPSTVTFSRPVVISGQLTGPGHAGATVTLHRNPHPYTGGFKQTGNPVVADNAGRYRFVVVPLLNTRYRVTASRTTPGAPAISPVVQVKVAIRVSIYRSDSTPRRGTLVRFYGSGKPAHDGARVSIQRRTSTGSYTTVARTFLRSATATRSTYSRRIRIRRSGTYRVKVFGDSDHVTGYSSRRTIRPHS